MKNVSEPGVYGVSRYGRSKYGKKSSCPQFAELSEILFLNIKDKKKLSKNQINDVMHLMAHANARNDIFLTSDKKDFIAKGRREKIKEKFNIVIMTPEEAVEFLSNEFSWN